MKPSEPSNGETYKAVVASFLVIALGLILALHFALIWVYGEILIYENSKILVSVEIVASLIIFVLGVERLVEAVHKAGGSNRRRPNKRPKANLNRFTRNPWTS